MLSTERGVISGSDYYIYTPGAQAHKLFFYPINTGYFRYHPGYSLQRNSYDSFLIMYITKGSCYVETNGRIWQADTGQIVLLDCYKPHAYWTDNGWDAVWLHFDGVMARSYYDAIVGTGSPVLTLKNNYRAEKYLRKMYEHFRDGSSPKEALFNSYIVNILTELFTVQDIDRSETSSQGAVEDTISYINEHLCEDLTIEKLCSQVSLSPYYFIRMFKRETGYSPHEYIIATRVNNAKFLLISSNHSIKDICFSCGFTNESAFCTTFKRMVGRTPSEFRKANVSAH